MVAANFLRSVRLTTLLSGLVVLVGCSWLPFTDERPTYRGPPRIADVVANLPELELPQAVAEIPTRQDVLAAYARVYGLIPDPADNHSVGKRLADLQMGIGEDRDIAGDDDPYRDAIDLYEVLLQNAAGDGKDEILYQLARAHDVVGQTDQTIDYLNTLIAQFPHSAFIVECRFRRAEIEFSREHFAQAARDYGYVVALGDTTPYWQNANYMRGWSQFKLGDLAAGLTSFFTVIDNVLGTLDASSLPRTEREILDDSFRVVTLALGYLDGPQTLARQMAVLERPAWQYLAYQTLADDYLAKERFLDSVATWQTFIEHNDLDPRAPRAHIGMIDTLVRADFPSDIQPKKAEFVTRYGIYSKFWDVHDAAVRDTYLATLHDYLSQLAKVAHARAQDEKKRQSKRRAYLQAAELYEQIVATFPEDPATAEYYFLLGEVYAQADEPARAVAAFQRVVRDFLAYERAPEAGYAAILELNALVATAPVADRELWLRLKIDSQIEFALLFSATEHAPAVQMAAADSLFQLAEYAESVELAQNFLKTWPQATVELKKTAWLIEGHGLFELSDFAAAELSYHRLLAIDLADAERSRVEDRLLAAVYKQGEASEAAGAADEAVAHYLRLRELNPDAELAVQGQFDAVAVIEEGGELARAAQLLADFRSRHPRHELARDINKRLADLYERTQDWTGAVAEYVDLAQTAEDAATRRRSLYRAAELYLELAAIPQAIELFRDYAHTYAEPAELTMEAMNHLDVLYQATAEPVKRRFWLAKKIDQHASMGANADARATYLAAEARFVLAEDERARFDKIRLNHPLQKSLKAKQRALTKTVKAFEAVAAYQVAEYSSASTYQIADLYSALSTSIMRSARPEDLSELELEQYEILLEEQAFPFEEQAISLHEINMRRSWEGVYDDWVKKSFVELSRLMPARFDKQEIEVAYVETIH